ncbi:type II toxin-antitoxin system HicB family antitoxin (plasmid) [Sphingomonas daechungensis]|uniref:Type II toxin-antitoxin system HicB family antitoxin n=1 Tax=Sphingomonas daechungensis TaxID=1176646 RepID=A0ABX6T3W9_9SPHN|nr:type II toxin-antitoxin system HicB family antitoxin [Sphingomonas daechungensis]QNP44576.1 type II toxin-antitoxin system HicB family antitoxin [Sphingomonas daechungensis]
MIEGRLVEVSKLSEQLGGGFVAFAPALKGCVADGESRAIALLNLEDAIGCWLEAARPESGKRLKINSLVVRRRSSRPCS